MTNLKAELKNLTNPDKAKILAKFFKTAKGQYGEGDIFLGITVPEQRKLAKKYKEISLKEIKELLKENIHEYRLTALLILVQKYETLDIEKKKEIFNFYLDNVLYINNWDLVDLTAPKIIGNYLLLFKEQRQILYNYAKSENLWQRRISIVSTYTFIKNQEYDNTLEIAKILLNDKHDLIHKAVGWMLREVGKKQEYLLKDFLNIYYKQMPRTMLRYAIEKFDKETRQHYLFKAPML